jgi:hypothetical protein
MPRADRPRSDVKQTQGLVVFITGWFLLDALIAVGESDTVALSVSAPLFLAGIVRFVGGFR